MASNEIVCQQNKIKVLCPLDPFSMYLYVRIYFIQFTCWNQWQIVFFHSQRLYQERHFNAQYHNIKFYSIFLLFYFLKLESEESIRIQPFPCVWRCNSSAEIFWREYFCCYFIWIYSSISNVGHIDPKMEAFSVKFIIKV